MRSARRTRSAPHMPRPWTSCLEYRHLQGFSHAFCMRFACVLHVFPPRIGRFLKGLELTLGCPVHVRGALRRLDDLATGETAKLQGSAAISLDHERMCRGLRSEVK